MLGEFPLLLLAVRQAGLYILPSQQLQPPTGAGLLGPGHHVGTAVAGAVISTSGDGEAGFGGKADLNFGRLDFRF